MERFDIHAHLLPGVDDGPEDAADSLEMARMAEADGTAVIVATPHQKDVMRDSSIDAVRKLADSFAASVSSRSGTARSGTDRSGGDRSGAAGIRVVLGMENHIEPELPDWVRDGRALTLNGSRYILCEPPFEAYPLYLDDTLFRLQQQGLVPVIAHPERCLPFQKQPARLAALVARGMLVQITGSSLLGEFARPARKAAEAFLALGIAHIVASDMHRPVRIRLPLLSQAHARAVELIGEERARRLFVDTPKAIVEGRDPDVDPFRTRARRGWWPFG
jgi:protein-tyrosine phosphatase